jgi:hypothetical protein
MWICHGGYKYQNIGVRRDLQIHTAFIINVDYSGLISSYTNNTWGRDFYQDPFEHKTKGSILNSYAIILPIVVEHFSFPRGIMLSHMSHFSWNSYNFCSLFHFLSSSCMYKLNLTTTGNFESTGFTVHEFLSFILVDSLHVFSTCLLHPSPLTKSKFWIWYFYLPTNQPTPPQRFRPHHSSY